MCEKILTLLFQLFFASANFIHNGNVRNVNNKVENWLKKLNVFQNWKIHIKIKKICKKYTFLFSEFVLLQASFWRCLTTPKWVIWQQARRIENC